MTTRVLTLTVALLGAGALVRCATWTPERKETANDCMRRCLAVQDPTATPEQVGWSSGAPATHGAGGTSCELRCSQEQDQAKRADVERVPPDPFKPGPSNN
jgi:hypothetical protein